MDFGPDRELGAKIINFIQRETSDEWTPEDQLSVMATLAELIVTFWRTTDALTDLDLGGKEGFMAFIEKVYADCENARVIDAEA